MTTSERLATGDQARGLMAEAPRGEPIERTLNDSLRRLLDSVRPEGIFGTPVEREGVTVIPCAEVWASFGAGGGSGVGPAPVGQPASGQTASTPVSAPGGLGIGGGGGAHGRPVSVITISRERTRVLPVVDVTKLMIAAMTTAGFVALLIGQIAVARSRGRRLGALSTMRAARALRNPLGRNV